MKTKQIILLLISLLVLGLLIFYFSLPALSIYNSGLVITILLAGLAVSFAIPAEKKVIYLLPKSIMAGLIALVFLISIFNSVPFNAKAYSSVFNYSQENFDDFEATLENVPLLDRASADNIALRKFGELSDYVSQYRILDSEQIVYQAKPVRVSLLEHASFWSWNRNKTSPGYILVDMQSQKAELVRTDQPIVYSDSTPFAKNINRYIRFHYPMAMFYPPTVELDDDGQVYWVAPTYKRIVGLFGGREINGLITVNAHSGQHTRYSNLAEIPEWIDNVYPSELIMEQYDYKGKLTNGYFNTWFAKTGMTMTTEGYNYMPINEDIWMFTGITSVSMEDESNIGFILTNKRTKETKFYNVTGAEEFSAMDSAEGEVQHLGYVATFPLLLNVEGIPTYLLSLKDKSNLVKSYAMVQVEDYRNVAVNSSLDKMVSSYINKVDGLNIEDREPGQDQELVGKPDIFTDLVEVEGRVQNKEILLVNGENYLFLEIDKKVYAAPLLDNLDLLFLEPGSQVKLTAYPIN